MAKATRRKTTRAKDLAPKKSRAVRGGGNMAEKEQIRKAQAALAAMKSAAD